MRTSWLFCVVEDQNTSLIGQLLRNVLECDIAGVGHCAWVVILTDLKNMADCHE
jgi:hypothetical protein